MQAVPVQRLGFRRPKRIGYRMAGRVTRDACCRRALHCQYTQGARRGADTGHLSRQSDQPEVPNLALRSSHHVVDVRSLGCIDSRGVGGQHVDDCRDLRQAGSRPNGVNHIEGCLVGLRRVGLSQELCLVGLRRVAFVGLNHRKVGLHVSSSGAQRGWRRRRPQRRQARR